MLNTAKTSSPSAKNQIKLSCCKKRKRKEVSRFWVSIFKGGEVQIDHGPIFFTAVPAGPKNLLSNKAISIRDFGLKAAWIEVVKVL